MTIDSDILKTQQRKNQRIKKQANAIANQLILDFDIHEGIQMAYFLAVPQGLDNFMAVRVWCKRELTELNDYDESSEIDQSINFEQLRAKFVKCFPQTLLETA
ncbi:hypothetical protein ACF3N0_10135 (plasmid) [Moraxella atlantae]|uniref:hypothetical protein n=1 Tax=Faucicola atlantae TaxID=34059 RepID=UPI003751DD72